ncbi:hypothetical protein [Lunatibacter salilacus]|uniref:hypothetical protein n=1 Tax=Lunatibacter salilacus TaxID=2483804 RepID=UPI00131DD3A8|nr:hypothetical protein [Lunatibacter salilacus]
MIRRFNIYTFPLLASIIDHIEATLECPKFADYSDKIEIDIWQNVKHKMPHNKEVAEKGFGFCITNYFESEEFKRIIIINLDNCNLAKFTDREIGAVIFHELGHLLNNPELAKFPTIMDHVLYGIDYSPDIADKFRQQNDIKMETFADSYANQNGFGCELISTFHKQNSQFEQKLGYLEERIKSIEKNEVFIGSVFPIEIYSGRN